MMHWAKSVVVGPLDEGVRQLALWAVVVSLARCDRQGHHACCDWWCEPMIVLRQLAVMAGLALGPYDDDENPVNMTDRKWQCSLSLLVRLPQTLQPHQEIGLERFQKPC